MTDTSKTLNGKLLTLMGSITVGKTARGYDRARVFRAEDVFNQIRPALIEAGIRLRTELLNAQAIGEGLYDLDLAFTFVDPQTGEAERNQWRHLMPITAAGGKGGTATRNQEMGMALTYARKNFLLAYFMIYDDGLAHPEGDAQPAKAHRQQRQQVPPPQAAPAKRVNGDGLREFGGLSLNRFYEEGTNKAKYRLAGDEPVSLWDLDLIANLIGRDKDALKLALSRNDGKIAFAKPLCLNTYEKNGYINVSKSGHPHGFDNPYILYQFTQIARHKWANIDEQGLARRLNVRSLTEYRGTIQEALTAIASVAPLNQR